MAAEKGFEMKWRGKEVFDNTRAVLRVRIGKASRMIERKVKERLSVSAQRTKGPRGGTVYANPSKPGESPHLRFGGLRKDVGHEVKESVEEVAGFVGIRKGSNADKYAKALEFGYPPGNLEPRPYLRKTVIDNAFAIFDIIAGKNK